MKTNPTIAKLLLLLLLVVSVSHARAYNFSATSATGQLLYYNILTDSTVAVTYPNHVGSSYYSGYTMPSGNLLIPASVTNASITYKVVAVDDYAFFNCVGLTGIILPNTLISIGDNACNRCTGLVSLYLSNSVTSLGDNSFNGCTSLASVDLPNSVVMIGVGAFQGCANLTSVTLGNHLSTINNLAFEGCNRLSTIAIPNSVTVLGNWAFCNCSSLDSLFIGTSVTNIQQNAFAGCPNIDYVYYDCRNASIAHQANVSSMPITSLRHLVIGDSVQSLPAYAFAGATHLQTIYLGISLSSIGDYAFASCDSLTRIESRNAVPPQLYANTFSSTDALLSVSCYSDSLYESALYWSSFDSLETYFPYQLVAVSNDTLRGTVSILQSPSCDNPVIQFQAIANEGYHFLRWDDDSVTNPRWQTLNSDQQFTAFFVSDYSFVNVTPSDTARGSVLGSGRYYYNTPVQLTAIPRYGYHFAGWNDGVMDNPRTITVLQDSFFTAQFLPNNYQLTVASADTNLGIAQGTGEYSYLSQVTVTAASNYGYHFSQWSDGITDNPRVLTLSSDSIVVAEFSPNTYFADIHSNDTLLGTVSGAGVYSYLSALLLQAVPAEHSHFQSWSDGDTNNPRQLVLTSDTNLTALFVSNYYHVVCLVNDSVMGTVQGAGNYQFGQLAYIEALPTQHHHFISWNDGTTANPRLVSVNSDTIFTANFAVNQQFDIQAVPSDPELGIVRGSGRYYYADTARLVAIPQGQHVEFYHWDDGIVDNPREISVISDAHYTAIFGLERFNLTLTTNDADLGILYGGGEYTYSSVATIYAVPYPYAEFICWNDGVTRNPRDINIVSDTVFQATFRYSNNNLSCDQPYDDGLAVTINHRQLQAVSSQPQQLAVYDIQGRLLSQSANGIISVTLPSSGIFFLKAGGQHVRKIQVH